MGPVRTTAFAAGFALLLGGCGSEAPPPAPSTPPKPVAPAAKAEPKRATPAPVAASQPQPATPEAFVYSPANLRDPFEPFIKLTPEKKKKPKVFVPRTPLQRFPTEELRLVGVVWGGGPARAKALIEDPTGKGYVVAVGTLVGDRGGAIAQIGQNEIVVEERFVDVLGEETRRVVKMTLRKPEGEVKQ
jgi:Tfp pilus assembly protein PilP